MLAWQVQSREVFVHSKAFVQQNPQASDVFFQLRVEVNVVEPQVQLSALYYMAISALSRDQRTVDLANVVLSPYR